MLKETFVKGGPVMWPLLACSLWAFACILERAMYWWQERRRLNSVEVDLFLEHLRRGRLKEALRAGHASGNPILKTLMASLAHGDRTLDDALELEVAKASEQFWRTLAGLDTAVTLAPLLGIFGTVTGIIKSFNLLGVSVVADPQAVSIGIAEALITTAAGLAIAMPSLISYNYFSSRSDKATFELERYAREFKILYAQAAEKKADHPEISSGGELHHSESGLIPTGSRP